MAIIKSYSEQIPPPVVEVRDVTHRFGNRLALDGVSLELSAGTVLGIVGLNGAGKSTLLSLVAGLLRPQSGTVRVFGQDVARAGGRDRRSRIGVVPQRSALYGELSAWQNLRFAAELYRVPDAGLRIAEVLEAIGFASRFDDPVSTLSGGMQRRLAIARGLLHDPEVLLLDEPTLGVDVEARHAIWNHLRAQAGRGKAILASTNYLDEAEALCDEVVVLRDGRVLVRDSPSALAARAGRCVVIDCDATAVEMLHGAFAGHTGLLREEIGEAGITFYLRGETAPDSVIRKAFAVAHVTGVRIRAPDLAEVFHALEPDSNA